jgi:hypothetical protein
MHVTCTGPTKTTTCGTSHEMWLRYIAIQGGGVETLTRSDCV